MDAATNPLLAPWEAPYGLPPFGALRTADFAPAFDRAMQRHRDELAAIAADARPADFNNTVAAFDAAGDELQRLEAVFYSLAASATSPELQAVQRELAAPLAAHWSAVFQHAGLFQRLDAVHTRRDAIELNAEQSRLLERLHLEFVRSGAQLDGAARARHAQIVQRLAQLHTAFAQNVLHDEADFLLELRDEHDLAGLPDWLRATARGAATERGREGAHGISLARSLVVPFLTFSTRRDLREAVWRAWVGRGEQAGEHDNRPLAREILALRRELAGLLGHATYADYAAQDSMAGTVDRVWALLDEVWQRGLQALAAERELVADALRRHGHEGELQAWDWRFGAEFVRRERYALDDSELKPYFPLPAMVAAVFDCAQRLFGIRFSARDDLLLYHPDVRAYDVTDADGRPIGLFLQDNFARPTKRSGAWMNSLRLQHRNGADVLPVVMNNNNFSRGAAGQPTLLSLDDVRTLFHEFGHGLHGLLSDVGYARLSGTNVLRDFVELPSQLFEHWVDEPAVLRRHARHWQTGEPIPDALLERIEAARRFGQAYETVRYTASAIVDLAAHASTEPVDDAVAFEQAVLAQRGAPAAAGLNHRLPHFQHLFGGSGYAAGYYVYLWAEVLDADAFQAFEEAGDPFHPEVAARLRRFIYASGDSLEPGAAYRAFRGRDPQPEAMLRQKGLI